MTSSPAAPYWPNTIAILVDRYGDTSNAALMGRLGWLLDLVADDKATVEQWEPLRARIEEHYTLDDPVESSVSDLITAIRGTNGEIAYRFSAAEYARRYAQAGDTPDRRIVHMRDARQVADFADRLWRLFVVTPENELLVHSHGMDVTELIMNRNNDGANPPLVHPTLVQTRGLTVKAAGEIAFTRTLTGQLGAVLNTKSGHFCPAPESAVVAAAVVGAVVSPDRVVPIPVRLRIPATAGRPT